MRIGIEVVVAIGGEQRSGVYSEQATASLLFSFSLLYREGKY
jgi:hypothetical protein